MLACWQAGEPAAVVAAETGLTLADAERACREVARREKASHRARELPPGLPVVDEAAEVA